MMGSWIKIETGLLSKPEVMALSAMFGISEYEIVGHLVALWAWVDSNLSPNCPRVRGTKKGLDRVAGRAGFVDAMIEVGWLTFDGEWVSVPNLDRHLSQSAKKRGEDARKKQISRARVRKVEDICPQQSGTKEGLDKIRGEEIDSLSNSSLSKNVRSVDSKPLARLTIQESPSAVEGSEPPAVSPLLNDPEFRESWRRWGLHRANKFKPLGAIEAEQQLLELGRCGVEEAKAILDFSVGRGALNLILTGDHRRANTPRHGGTRKTKGAAVRELWTGAPS